MISSARRAKASAEVRRTVNAAGLNVTSLVNRYDVINLTLGASVLVNESFTVRPAMVIPLNDDQFDYEAMVQMNFWR